MTKKQMARSPERATRTTEKQRQSNSSRTSKAPTARIVVEDVEAFIRRFIWLPNESLYFLVAVWIVGTYLVDEFSYFGYLFVWSPTKACGKSKMLEVLSLLSFNSTGIQLSMTEAVLFRTAFGYTQLVDEVDSHLNVEALRAVLNGGYARGASVTRMHLGDEGKYVPMAFPVYAARAFAAIEETTLSETTRDRCFRVKMERRASDAGGGRLRADLVADDVKRLTVQLASWSSRNREAVRKEYREHNELPHLNMFSERTRDISEPLAATVEVMYANRAELPAIRERLCGALAFSRTEPDSYKSAHSLFRGLHSYAEKLGSVTGTATELASIAQLNEDDATRTVSVVLRSYGYRTRSVRKGGTPKYRYTLTCEDLEGTLRRYFGGDSSKRHR